MVLRPLIIHLRQSKQRQTKRFAGAETAQNNEPRTVLSPELRLQIYEYLRFRPPPAFVELSDLKHHPQRGRGCQGRKRFHMFIFQKNLFRLMRTCKTVHNEVAALLYSQQPFQFANPDAPGGFFTLSSWLYTIQPRHAHYLRHIRVAMPIVRPLPTNGNPIPMHTGGFPRIDLKWLKGWAIVLKEQHMRLPE